MNSEQIRISEQFCDDQKFLNAKFDCIRTFIFFFHDAFRIQYIIPLVTFLPTLLLRMGFAIQSKNSS